MEQDNEINNAYEGAKTISCISGIPCIFSAKHFPGVKRCHADQGKRRGNTVAR